MAYIDIYTPSSSSLYNIIPRRQSFLPLTIILSGNGNFLNPYYINDTDPILAWIQPQKSLHSLEDTSTVKKESKNYKQAIKRQKTVDTEFKLRIKRFFNEFNFKSRFIDFQSRKRNLRVSLGNIIDYVKSANETYFAFFNLAVDVVILQVIIHIMIL